MNKYVIHFSKKGYIKYTSHLDMLRLFKRAFKKTGISLVHSQGFNPHPKMGFAQPLSLGYTSSCEFLEFETQEVQDEREMAEKLSAAMPEGIEIHSCSPFDMNVKSLAAATVEAEYTVTFPVKTDEKDYQEILCSYLNQSEILAEKRQKKTKKMVASDIRPKIRSMEILHNFPELALNMRLDCGSASNLSPEQVIASFIKFADMNVQRFDIDVERKKLFFDKI